MQFDGSIKSFGGQMNEISCFRVQGTCQEGLLAGSKTLL